jgi:hypothetical protein
MRLTWAIILTLAIWFPLGALIGSRYTPLPRPPGAHSFVGIEKHAEGEFMYVIHFDRQTGVADTPENRTRSPIAIYENDRPLGPPHSSTTEIKSHGRGRYVHWEQSLYFSSSDNTDPRSNGRQYSWTYGPPETDHAAR